MGRRVGVNGWGLVIRESCKKAFGGKGTEMDVMGSDLVGVWRAGYEHCYWRSLQRNCAGGWFLVSACEHPSSILWRCT